VRFLVFRLVFTVVFSLAPRLVLCAPDADDSAYQNALRLLSEGRAAEARAALRTVIAQQPEHAGAWLDLAILQCGMGMPAEAEALFAQILERFDPPPSIRELIRQVRARGCLRHPPRRVSRFQVRLGRGHDSNANQGAANPFSLGGIPLAPEFHPRADDFTQIGLEAASLFPRQGTMVHAQIQSRRHDHLSGYDQTTVLAAVEQPLRPGGWEFRLGLAAGASMLGGHLYQKQAGLYGQASPPWTVLPAGWRYSFGGDISRVRYPALDSFDASILRARFTLAYQNAGTWFMGSLGIARDFGARARPGGDKKGWTATLALRQRLGERLAGELSWARQDWEGEKVYFAGLADTNTRRAQHATLWRAALTGTLTDRQELTLEYRELDNRENISLFSYRSKQVLLYWQYAFGE
jgi:hypothetical protein